jgi:hypothetical protein
MILTALFGPHRLNSGCIWNSIKAVVRLSV